MTHSAWLSRNIHSGLSLPISRRNKTQQLLHWGTLKGILWGRWESQAEWQPMPQPIFGLSWLGDRGGGEDGGGEGRERDGEGVAAHRTAFLHHRSMVISTHRKNAYCPEWVTGITLTMKKCTHKMSRNCFVLGNEAWTATSQDCPRLSNTQCTQNKRRAITHSDADDIFPWTYLYSHRAMCGTSGTDAVIL